MRWRSDPVFLKTPEPSINEVALSGSLNKLKYNFSLHRWQTTDRSQISGLLILAEATLAFVFKAFRCIDHKRRRSRSLERFSEGETILKSLERF